MCKEGAGTNLVLLTNGCHVCGCLLGVLFDVTGDMLGSLCGLAGVLFDACGVMLG